MATEATSDRIESADVDNANVHDPIEYIVLGLVAFRRAAHRTVLVFQVKTISRLSCSRLHCRRVKFAENGTESLGWFSFRWRSMHHLECVLALGCCQAVCPDPMAHPTGPNSKGTILSTIPAGRMK